MSEKVARLERGKTGGRRRRSSFAYWRKHIDVIDFLENMEVANIRPKGEQVEFSCPFPDHTSGDSTPSAAMNNGSIRPHLTTAWKCLGCGRGGTAIDFVAEYNNVSRQEAARGLKEHYAKGFIAPRYGSISREFEERRKVHRARHEERKLPLLGIEELRRFDVDWGHYAEEYGDYADVRYMLDRGFTPATLDEWGIGYDDSSKRFTIPVCDHEGNLVGFKGRAWKPNARPKYLVIGDKERRKRYGFPTYDKTLVVFGLDKCADSDSQTLVLTEGELDVISLWVMGIPAICCGSAGMSPEQARLIRQHCDEVVLFFDNDKAGHNAVHGIDRKDGEHRPGIIEMLEPFIRVRVVGAHRYDANDYLRRGEQEQAKHLISSAVSSYLL